MHSLYKQTLRNAKTATFNKYYSKKLARKAVQDARKAAKKENASQV